ncbi:unnamed protein product, partial [Meganyctiphanes norvegica]
MKFSSRSRSVGICCQMPLPRSTCLRQTRAQKGRFTPKIGFLSARRASTKLSRDKKKNHGVTQIETCVNLSVNFSQIGPQTSRTVDLGKGILVKDTERLYTEATQLISSEYGKTYTWEVKAQCMGMKGDMAAKHIIDSMELPLTVDEYLKKISFNYDKLFPSAKLLPGAEKLVRHLHKHKTPIAIASGGSKDSFDLKTTNHKQFFELFQHIVLASTDQEVKNGKPAPDVFLVCADRFPDKPELEKCLVFEDAPNGVKAAIAAKMQVVMVPDERLSKELTVGATQVHSSLEDFKPEDFGLPPYDA